jgi:hypothetical protein
VDKGYVGKSGQTPFASSLIAFNPEWGHKLDVWMSFLNGVSEYVNNRYWTEKVLTDSWAVYQDLVSWGVDFRKDKDGKVLRAPVTAGVTEQIMYAHSARNSGPSTQNHGQVLRRQVEKSGIKIMDRVMISELLKQNGRIVGAIGIPMENFDLYTFIAKTTILCVGGCSFKPLGYPPLVPLTGDGEGMAYRAGAEIVGKEFIATNYTCVDTPSIIGRRGLPEDLDAFLGMEKLPPGEGLWAAISALNSSGCNYQLLFFTCGTENACIKALRKAWVDLSAHKINFVFKAYRANMSGESGTIRSTIWRRSCSDSLLRCAPPAI